VLLQDVQKTVIAADAARLANRDDAHRCARGRNAGCVRDREGRTIHGVGMRKNAMDDEAILRAGNRRGNANARHSAAGAGRLSHSRDGKWGQSELSRQGLLNSL
jgi:hypothetical protein